MVGRHPQTNVGYINRTCVEVYQTPNEDSETSEEDEHPAECIIDHLAVQQGLDKFDNLPCDDINQCMRTFGKKGKGVGEFQDATDVTCMPRGKVLVTDMINSRIQLCLKNGNAYAVYKGEEFPEPWATCLTPSGDFAMTSRKRKCVIIVSQEGEILWSFGTGYFECPSGVVTNKNHDFIVSDVFTNRVSIHDKSGQFIKYIGNPKIKEQQFSKPRYVCVSVFNDIIVSDSGHHCIKIFDENGHYLRSVGRFGKMCGQLKTPYGICTDNLGHVLVADHYNNRVSMFTRDGAFMCHVVDEQHGVIHPKGIALSNDLDLYITTGNLKAYEIKVFKLKCTDPTVIANV
ncbi:hypothetical protein ACF0H5_008264 [Mactra antiquata]